MVDKKQKADEIDKVNTDITWIDVSAGSATHFSLTGAPAEEELVAELSREKERKKAEKSRRP